MKVLKKKLVCRRDLPYDRTRSWLDNALDARGIEGLHAILADVEDPPHECVLSPDRVDVEELLMKAPSGIVPRTAEELSANVRLLLAASKRITLVDPHFVPHQPRFSEPIKLMLEHAADTSYRSFPPTVELHTAAPDGKGERFCDVERSCKGAALQRLIPSGMTLTVVIWCETETSDQLHNRFVLTERGGISFGHGLDAATQSQNATDDLHRLTEEQRKHRLGQYTGKQPAFAELARFTVESSRSPS